MSFTQFKLEIATEQSRGIFNSYVYKTTDTIAESQTVGYFEQSRFADDPDWVGSFLTVKAADGNYESIIQEGGTVSPVVPVEPSTMVQRFTSAGTINAGIDLVFSTGTFTLVMPTINNQPLNLKSISGTATLDPGTNTFEGTNTVPALASRVFFLDGTVWRDIS